MDWLRRLMAGRYGTDQLGWATLILYLLISLFVPVRLGRWLALIPLVIFWARFLSRDSYRRRCENDKFMSIAGPLIDNVKRWNERIKDREHKYFTCPKCRQTLRVPRGRGKIEISCPSCHNTIIKKT